jgi:acetyl-CoA carboxylase carboxyl transferase subunit alpha
MRLAEKFSLPLISLVDTPAAESRLEAEERGISESIARNLATLAGLQVPILVAVIGEGGSGGAIALGLGDWVMMLEHAIYSVIPPESCAVILETFGRDPAQAPQAAEALRLAARQTLELGVIDEIIPEPLGGAHRNPQEAARLLSAALVRNLGFFCALPREELRERRYRKYRALGSLTAGEQG